MSIKAKLKKVLNKYSNDNGACEIGYIDKSKPYVSDGLYFFTEEKHGGGEGDGEEYWIVLNVTYQGSVSFWQIPGYYQSYDGGELEIDNIFEVKPVEKMVIVWEEK